MSNNLLKSLILHIKYPYTALVIALIWLGISIIIGIQPDPQADLLIISAAATSLIIAIIGFSSPK